jgi:hypothetical protein
VLDGALDPFMAAALSQRVTGEKVERGGRRLIWRAAVLALG